METIKIMYHNPDLLPIEQKEGGDWIDLRAAENVILKKGEWKLISLGVSMELPKGYEAHIVPRSSTFKNFGIIQTNSVGIVDNAYNSSEDVWCLSVLAIRDTEIHLNDRICQFRIVKNQPKLLVHKATHLDNKTRGGFGSTGIK